MSVKKILVAPDPILNKKCDKVGEMNSEIEGIVKDLKDTLDNSKTPGAGLAAPQIGYNKKVCIIREFFTDLKNPNKETFEEHVLINPEIRTTSGKTGMDWEGCLSIPDSFGMVKRTKKIKVKALNEKGEKVSFTATDFFAREIQHEVDHLDGILFDSKVVGKMYTDKELDELYEVKGTSL
jgi:peptide deformylase